MVARPGLTPVSDRSWSRAVLTRSTTEAAIILPSMMRAACRTACSDIRNLQTLRFSDDTRAHLSGARVGLRRVACAWDAGAGVMPIATFVDRRGTRDETNRPGKIKHRKQ